MSRSLLPQRGCPGLHFTEAGSVLMSVTHATTEDHKVSGLCYSWKPCGCLWVGFAAPEAIVMVSTDAVPEDPKGVLGPTAARLCVDACSPCHH